MPASVRTEITEAYRPSHSAFSRSGMPSYELIRARPVSPGLQAKAPFCARYSQSWRCAGRAGRGPTRLMSPFTTLNNCGSSSMLVRRMNFPTLVTSADRASAEGISTVFTGMLRNLRTVNRDPLRPTRRCRNNAGTPSSSLMARAVSKRTGDNTIRPVPAMRMSRGRFRYNRYMLLAQLADRQRAMRCLEGLRVVQVCLPASVDRLRPDDFFTPRVGVRPHHASISPQGFDLPVEQLGPDLE